MDSELIQRTRYVLQARVRWTKTCPLALFPSACRHLLAWIEASPFVASQLATIDHRARGFEARMRDDLPRHDGRAFSVEGPWTADTREDAAALALAALRYVSEQDLSDGATNEAMLLAFVLAGNVEDGHTLATIVDVLRDVAVQQLSEFIDEEIDGRHAVLGLLVKYQARSELYRRHRLRDAAENGIERRTGEAALAFDLYEYLHDQGVDFSIESKSASGRPDLIARARPGTRIVADAKYIPDGSAPSKAIGVVGAGFRQVRDYCRDHNEPVGYLVIFVASDITIDIKGSRDDGFPCFRAGGYTVYYVIVDIHDHPTTASKRPQPRVVEITEADVLQHLAGDAPVPEPADGGS